MLRYCYIIVVYCVICSYMVSVYWLYSNVFLVICLTLFLRRFWLCMTKGGVGIWHLGLRIQIWSNKVNKLSLNGLKSANKLRPLFPYMYKVAFRSAFANCARKLLRIRKIPQIAPHSQIAGVCKSLRICKFRKSLRIRKLANRSASAKFAQRVANASFTIANIRICFAFAIANFASQFASQKPRKKIDVWSENRRLRHYDFFSLKKKVNSTIGN